MPLLIPAIELPSQNVVGGSMFKHYGSDDDHHNHHPSPREDPRDEGVLIGAAHFIGSHVKHGTHAVELRIGRFVEETVLRVFHRFFDKSMDIANEALKKSIDDPYMPSSIRRIAFEMVDALWPDTKLELHDMLMPILVKRPPIKHGDGVICCPCIGHVWAFIRYNLFPYDRGPWRQLWNPVRWIFTLLSLVPTYSIGQILYIVLFFFIDLRDEYQLVAYITGFKGLQFINLGLVSAAVGCIQYYVCVTRSPSSCQSDAPRADLPTIVVFLIQVIVIWIAFVLTLFAEKKAGYYYYYAPSKTAADLVHKRKRLSASTVEAAVEEELEEMVEQERRTTTKKADPAGPTVDDLLDRDSALRGRSRGRLLVLLLIDLSIFALVVVLGLWLTFYNLLDPDSSLNPTDPNPHWKWLGGLYWLKAFYGAMSFPFVILVIPFFKTLVTHAKATAYNPYGQTVPYLGVESEEDVVPWDPERHTRLRDERKARESEKLE